MNYFLFSVQDHKLSATPDADAALSKLLDEITSALKPFSGTNTKNQSLKKVQLSKTVWLLQTESALPYLLDVLRRDIPSSYKVPYSLHLLSDLSEIAINKPAGAGLMQTSGI